MTLATLRQQHLGRLLLEVSRDFQRRSLKALQERGFPELRASHKQVLIHLALDGSRVTELAERAGMTKQAMGRLVDDVQALGLVERVADPRDGRAKIVRPTARGRELYEVGMGALEEVRELYEQRLGAERIAGLHETLVDLAQGLGLRAPDK